MNEYSKPHSNFMGGSAAVHQTVFKLIHPSICPQFVFMKKEGNHNMKNFLKAKKMNSFFYNIRILILSVVVL